jgi:hypothetical protein
VVHRFIVGEATAEPYISVDGKTASERSGFGRALNTEGVWQKTVEVNFALPNGGI